MEQFHDNDKPNPRFFTVKPTFPGFDSSPARRLEATNGNCFGFLLGKKKGEQSEQGEQPPPARQMQVVCRKDKIHAEAVHQTHVHEVQASDAQYFQPFLAKDIVSLVHDNIFVVARKDYGFVWLENNERNPTIEMQSYFGKANKEDREEVGVIMRLHPTVLQLGRLHEDSGMIVGCKYMSHGLITHQKVLFLTDIPIAALPLFYKIENDAYSLHDSVEIPTPDSDEEDGDEVEIPTHSSQQEAFTEGHL